MGKRRPQSKLWGLFLGPLLATQAVGDCAPVKGQTDTIWPSDKSKWLYPTFHLQASLKRFGAAPITVDGDLGPGTSKALRAYQRQNGLAVTGKPDVATLTDLTTKWAVEYRVPPMASKPNTAVVNPDFTVKTRVEDGRCIAQISWPDAVKDVALPLKQPVMECRLTQFNGVPHYVQMLGTFGVMISVRSDSYVSLPHQFGVPVIAVYPDRTTAIGIELFENYAKTETPVAAAFPNYEGPYENKVFDFHQISARPHDPVTSHSNWLWKSWETCGPDAIE